MLACHHGGSGWHATNVLVVRPTVIDAMRGQLIDRRGARHLAAIATKRVIAHLIRSDEENVSSHASFLYGALPQAADKD